ncbi:hypothetical protein EXN66_Car022512 [Channa argus]|uniref:LBH domain-containing protein n=1 Tax=Channa argus TaxID=215402 RepID=A0A6G1QVV4_CHAAH|nr:hypothetical protein EXN66_Car022512 [Channa argus]KAK2879915.1 hypothetical protein Q8A73_023727 [Channa argus]
MSCIPASHSMNSILTQVEPQIEESPVQRRESRVYQIFPEANMEEELDCSSYPEDFLYRRERLPSIVVEPTDHSEPESEQLCWPLRCQMSNTVEKEQFCRSDNAEGSVNQEQHEDLGMEGGVVKRKSSLGPSQSQLSISRLTPPASPTTPEAVPPCLKS